MHRSITKVVLSFVVSLILVVFSIQAHSSDTLSNPVYFVAGDNHGISQVFQYLVGSDQPARRITHSASDVIRFGVAYDGLAIAYISDDQLWLQPIHSHEAESLTTIENTMNIWTNPIFSQDGNYVAYEDNGVWLYDLANRQTRQILQDVPLAETASNANEYRGFKPQVFIANEAGTVTSLRVDISKWEWNTTGVYDLETGELLELDSQLHSDILPLADGRVLVFGNSGAGGEGSLHLADSLAEINNAERLVLFHELTEGTLFAEQAIEVETGIVRVFGSATTLTQNPEQTLHFYFDFELNTSAVRGDVKIINLAESVQAQDVYADAFELSPDGNHLPLYVNPRFGDASIIYGEVNILNFVTGETTALSTVQSVSAFQFQPR